MKERKISRRAVCSAMVASLALGVLEGCGSSSSTTASSAAGSGAAASNERITVRILKSKAANEVAAEQMDVWKVLGEKFNMDFEFDNPPQDNYNERLNLVMMDAQLPDIIMDMPTTEVLKYGESGVILSLNDYIDNSMPNLKKEIDKRDGVEKALTYSDGNIYYMPMLDEKVSGNMPYIVRTDWLEKLGIESPVTLEDWENYWHLVKTTDLNGNGTFTFAQSSGPFILSQDEVTQLDDDSVNRAKQDCIIPFLEESKKYVIPGSTSFSSEDDAVRRAVMADVDTYVDEMIIKFVSGREPLSNWDTYVEKVNGMGIAEVIDIYQKTLNG